MELLKVYFTERSWCGYWPQFEILLMVYSAGIWIALQFTRHYNSANLVRSTRGCTGSTDPIACLCTVPFDTLMTVVNKSPNSFSLTSVRLGWQPSVDGQIIVRNPQESLQQGLSAKVGPHFFFFYSSPFNWGPFFNRFLLFPAIAMTKERKCIESIITI